MTKLLRAIAPALLAIGLAGCTIIPDGDTPATVSAAPPGTPVALGQAVQVGTLVVTPMAVVEDSRCPINARCVWAGRLVVTTRIDGAGWRDTADLTLGEPWSTHGLVLAMTSGEPAPEAGEGKETPREAYRFTYEAR